jgi:hypothetical protein
MGQLNVLSTLSPRVPRSYASASSGSSSSSSTSALRRPGTLVSPLPEPFGQAAQIGARGTRRRGALSLASGVTGLTYGCDSTCITCATEAQRHLPPLPQCERTTRLCTLIVSVCHSARVVKPGTGAIARGFMIGVLAHADKVYVAMSGSRTLREFEDAIQRSRRHVPELATLRFAGEIGARRLTAGGAVIDRTWATEIRDRSPAGLFECAAPKLIHHVLHNVLNLTPGAPLPDDLGWSMTEMWVGPSDGYHQSGDIYASCPNCRQILPMMLCGLAPGRVEEDEDGFRPVVTKGMKREMRAGRK